MSVPTVSPNLDIRFSAKWWSFITSTRKYVASFCAHFFAEAGASEKVAMAAHELLENAVKFSKDPDSLVTCELLLEEDKATLRVENTAKMDNIEVLREEMASVAEGDALTIYLEKMQRSFESTESRLGLSRIIFEGEAELRMTIDGERVLMEATLPIAKQEA